MTPEQMNAKIAQRIQQLDKIKLIYPVATKIHDDMTRRLFNNGLGGDGLKLSQKGKGAGYDASPSYFTKKQFKKTGSFRAQGKVRGKKTVAKSAKTNVFDVKTKKKKRVAIKSNHTERTSMYLPRGYKQLREIQGMEASFVNLTYSADLRNDFATKLGTQNNTVVAKVSRKINQDKIKWMTEKYGPATFKHTKEEKDFFKQEVTKRLTAYLSA